MKSLAYLTCMMSPLLIYKCLYGAPASIRLSRPSLTVSQTSSALIVLRVSVVVFDGRFILSLSERRLKNIKKVLSLSRTRTRVCLSDVEDIEKEK